MSACTFLLITWGIMAVVTAIALVVIHLALRLNGELIKRLQGR